MATFNYTVDTQPMAEEIGSVSNQVKETTSAVVAMQTAIVIAEEKAANHVCDNVNKGFYTLIRSQISQKIAKLQSDIDSHLLQLNHQKKQLMAVKDRMERDYNMISNRYLKLFNSLNTNLKQRVFELDKPTIDFAVKEVEKGSNRTKYLTASVPIIQLESLAISQKIIASNLKFRGLNVINTMTRFLVEMNKQKELTDRILLERNGKIKNATWLVPVIICESNYDKSDNKKIEITVCSVELSKHSQSEINNIIMSEAENFQWQKELGINKDILSECNNMLNSSKAPQRVIKMANKLIMSFNFQTL